MPTSQQLLCPGSKFPFINAPLQAYGEWDQAARRLVDAKLIEAAVAAGVGAHPGESLPGRHAGRLGAGMNRPCVGAGMNRPRGFRVCCC